MARFPRKNKFMIRIFDIPRSGRSLFPPKAHPGPPRASSGPGLGQGEIWVGPGVTEFTICCKKQWFLQIWNSPPDPADPADQVSGAAVRDLPSTRAGGQDDVSSQTNSLKLHSPPWADRSEGKSGPRHTFVRFFPTLQNGVVTF